MEDTSKRGLISQLGFNPWRDPATQRQYRRDEAGAGAPVPSAPTPTAEPSMAPPPGPAPAPTPVPVPQPSPQEAPPPVLPPPPAPTPSPSLVRPGSREAMGFRGVRYGPGFQPRGMAPEEDGQYGFGGYSGEELFPRRTNEEETRMLGLLGRLGG